MTIDEALDVTCIYSVADQLPADTPLIQNRPFRAPHHTISHTGPVGGGNWPRSCSTGQGRWRGEFLVSAMKKADRVTLKERIESGKITPVVDKVYPLNEVREAYAI